MQNIFTLTTIMSKIYLPNLKKIKIHNFSLYPNDLDFEYDFINGVNLIMGGNGMGKTTFVNIIKYAIIGHYKKGFDFTRTYKGRKIEKRQSYPRDYYKNRQDEALNLKEKATVTIEFKLNNDYFIITRCLEDISLKSVLVNNSEIEGKITTQQKYDSLSEDENTEFLYYKYEDQVSKSSGVSFDDLIFFVNEILYFGEDHKTVLWNDEFPNVQEELFNKYFNEPLLDLERREAIRQAKYYDSMSRHKSEDIRAITKVLDGIKNNESQDKEKSLSEQVLSLRNSIEKLDKEINSKQSERKKVDDKIRRLNNKINDYSQEETELEKRKKVAEHKKLSGKWMNLHKSYDLHFQSLKINGICPMCNQELADKFVEEKVDHDKNCFVCSQKIIQINSDEIESEYQNLNNQLIENYDKVNNAQKQISEEEKIIVELDDEFRNLVSQKRQLQSKLRKLEYDSQNEDNPVGELQAFYDEIDNLQEEKKNYQEKSKLEKNRAEEIYSKIENQIAENTSKFSALFSEFAESFLGVKCSLTFDDAGDDKKRFYPVINKTIRYTEEELSESQRFFVDHSFRMSILRFFYTKPTFYIVETPNSSLDISYEKRAAEVFTKFLEKPNALIITTNLNNSEFLTHLIEETDNVSAIDLLKIGKKSFVQHNSESMTTIYNNIDSQINNGR